MVKAFARTVSVVFVLIVSLIASPVCAEIEAGDLSLTVTPERNGGVDPFPGEMVLLKIRGIYKQPIMLEELVQPSLANFSWTQLGRDHWGKVKLSDGRDGVVFDRTIAVFPHHTGKFVIEPFIHRLTVNDSGERHTIPVSSSPIPLSVVQWRQATGGPNAKEPWWLPARSVTITDSWDPDPETIKIGETTRRIVTIEARGMVAEGLPPRPVMRTRGILTFAGPVTRETLVTPSGPVAKVTYQWDVRPGVPEVIPLDAIAIPWFDTTTRTLREAEIPARQIGHWLTGHENDGDLFNVASPIVIGAVGFLSFGFGLFVIDISAARVQIRLSAQTRKSLSRAACRGDCDRFCTVLLKTQQNMPRLVKIWQKDPAFALKLAKLTGKIYAQHALALPDLSELARDMSRGHRSTEVTRPSVLKRLDGLIG